MSYQFVNPAHPVKVASPNVKYHGDYIESTFKYETTSVKIDAKTNEISAAPKESVIKFNTLMKPRKCGVLLVGWGGKEETRMCFFVLTTTTNKATMGPP